MMEYKITETDLNQAIIEGKQKAINYVYDLIKKGNTTGQIIMALDIECNILNDLNNTLQKEKDKELGLE